MSELFELKDQFEELQKNYRQHLPNVDPALIDDLLLRQMENPGVAPMYMVEVFTRPGLDTEKVRDTIIAKTGQCPAIYDNGTHYATHHRLTLDLLKEISGAEGVIEVTGEYSGDSGSWAASHEHGTHESWYAQMPQEQSREIVEANKEEHRKNDYRIAIYTAAGIVGAIALAGFIISGGILPNANVNQVIPAGTEPGLLHGYVAGPQGLPAIGASILAVKQGEAFAASEFVSVNGQYDLNLPPGNYIIVAAYPDGTEKTVYDYDIERGSSHELNFAY
jgi:hypothetical protein